MNHTRLLLQSLRYHWRTNLAVFLGVVIGTAVLAGALIVGDSVRGSLRAMTLVRLGQVDHVLTGPRFFRESLAEELQQSPGFQQKFSKAAPAIALPASMEKRSQSGEASSEARVTRAGKIDLYAVDERLWDLTEHGTATPPQGTEVVISRRLADQLEAREGDDVLLVVELPSSIPRDSLLGERSETSRTIPLTVKTVLPDDLGLGRFGLHPDQQLPLDAFIDLDTLQDRLGLAEQAASRRHPHAKPARANALFVAGNGTAESASVEAAKSLTDVLSQTWQLADFNLRTRENPQPKYVSLESDRMILDQAVSTAARQAAEQHPASPVLVYLINEFNAGKQADAYSMYSVIAGLDADLFTEKATLPFGPFEWMEGPPKSFGEGSIESGGEGEIVLNEWLAEDLHADVGDVVAVKYHTVGSHGELPEEERKFRIQGIVKLTGPAADRGLTPEVPGITDANTLGDWDQPFEMKMSRITKRDEAYWDQHRATPKAFVTLKTAQFLWGSRYGDLTSFRVAAPSAKSPDQDAKQPTAPLDASFTKTLLSKLSPTDTGMAFLPIKAQGLAAASGTTDFSGLFIGFSFFLILSAMILIGLLFRLSIERRAANVGLLLATGFSPRQVRNLLLGEGTIVFVTGGLVGVLAAIGYAWTMILGLKTWWIGAIGTRFLDLYVQPGSVAMGVAIAIVVAWLSALWGVRMLNALSPRSLLAGETQASLDAPAKAHRGRRAARIGLISAIVSVVLSGAVVSGGVPNVEAFAGLSWPIVIFFLVGIGALVAGLAFLSAWLDSDRGAAVHGSTTTGLARLSVRNAGRQKTRSVLTVGLIASASFLIVAIAAGHRNPAVETPQFDSGNGGFSLVAESTIPVLADLNTPAGRDTLDLTDDDAARILKPMTSVIPFRLNPGENASCLNIYQTKQPTLLGVPDGMIRRGGFKFVGDRSRNPWEKLEADSGDEPIPVFGDMNTLMYSLHAGPGQVLEIRDEANRPVKVRIAGMLDGSVFQGVLLMGERPFRKLFPSRVGYRYFLIEVPPSDAAAVAEILETKIAGFDAEPVAARLADFLAVQNTYLSTFQTLGGLGLLLGTFGLATVMLRNVLERRAELALFRAVGFRTASVAWLVLCENTLLLGWGLGVGAASALLAMTPHLLSTGADVPWLSTSATLAGVFAAGMVAAWFAVREAVRTPVVSTLRSE